MPTSQKFTVPEEGRLGFFSRMACTWAVNMGMRSEARHSAASKSFAAPEASAELGLDLSTQAKIHIVLQPKIGLSNGQVCGFEAFASPEVDGKRVPASVFVPAVEMAGAQIEFDWRVLEAGFALAGAASAGKNAPISFNVNPITIASVGFAQRLDETAKRHGVDLGGMKIEVLEKMPLSFLQIMQMKIEMGKARLKGFHFSIDDFGTCDANCGMLELPAEELKIDAYYIKQMGRPQARAWISAMVRLAKDKGMSVCAEGVEHKWQADALRGLGVDVGQGYFWSKPVEAKEALWMAPVGAERLSLVQKLLARRVRGESMGARPMASSP